MGPGTGSSLLGILPLLAAGFIFNGIFFITRFRLGRADGQRLFFSCAIAGFAVGALAFVLRALLRDQLVSDTRLHSLMSWAHDAIPVPFGLTYLGSIVLAIVLALLANLGLGIYKLITDRHDRRRLSVWVYWRTMSEHVTALDELLRRVMLEDSLVLLCLKSRKVYCGIVSDITGKQQSAVAHVQIIPAFSITRDKDSLRFLSETRTEYRAYGLKVADDRLNTLDRLVRQFVSVYVSLSEISMSSTQEQPRVAKRLESIIIGHTHRVAALWGRTVGFVPRQGDGSDFRRALRKHIRSLLSERKKLRRLLEPYLQGGKFDASAWAKVIPVTEIESASSYKPGPYEKWFVDTSAQGVGKIDPW